MSYFPTILTQLVRAALGRNQGAALAGHAPLPSLNHGAASPDLRHPGPGSSRGSDAPDDSFAELDPGLISILGEKVLHGWLRNRYQLLFPLALDLRRLDDRQAELLVHAMIAAAQADGSFDRSERLRIDAVLSLVDPLEDETAYLEQAIRQPKPLRTLLADVTDTQSGALVYAASLMAVDQRNPTNRYYLKYLAARLNLSEELVLSLEKRYRA